MRRSGRLKGGAGAGSDMNRLEQIAPRGVLMVVPCLIGFNLWRVTLGLGMGVPFSAAINAAGVMAVILCLSALRMAPREVVSTALVVFVASLAAASSGDIVVFRVILGGLFLIAAWTAWEHAGAPFDKALAFGLWSEFVVWALGNANRGTFGPDVAMSAIGQAYGAWAQPAQWAAIVAAYLVAWYNNRKATMA